MFCNILNTTIKHPFENTALAAVAPNPKLLALGNRHRHTQKKWEPHKEECFQQGVFSEKHCHVGTFGKQ